MQRLLLANLIRRLNQLNNCQYVQLLMKCVPSVQFDNKVKYRNRFKKLIILLVTFTYSLLFNSMIDS